MVMPLEALCSAAGASPSTILIGTLFRTGAPRAGLSDDERDGVVVLSTSGESFLLAVGVTVVVVATFTGGETAVADLVGGGLTIGFEGGFHIGPLGGTAYQVHKPRFLFIITRSYLFLSFNLCDTCLDALQFLPRKHVIGFDLDHFKEVYVSGRD